MCATTVHGPGRRVRRGRQARAGAWGAGDPEAPRDPGTVGRETRGRAGAPPTRTLHAAAVTWPVCVTFSPVGEVRTPKHLAPGGRLSAAAPPPLHSSREKVTAAAILRADP